MKVLSLCIALSMFILTMNFAQAQESNLQRIKVEGNQFINEDGKVIVFHGMNASDPDKLEKDGKWNKEYFDQIKAWGANLVRFPVHPSRLNSRGKDAYLKLLDDGIQWATENELYVIIDWHIIGNLKSELFQHKMYETNLKETFEFWITMSRRYGKNNTVAFFEFYNEPTTGHGMYGLCTWDELKEIYDELIAITRAHGSEAISLVAGFNWAYDLSEVSKNLIEAENIAYVSHPYPQKREKPWEEKWTKDWGFLADQYPLILTEIGFCGPDDRGAHIPVISDESYGDTIVKYTEEKGISWVLWVFDPNWSPMLFEDWDYTPTRQGKYFKQVLQGSE